MILGSKRRIFIKKLFSSWQKLTKKTSNYLMNIMIIVWLEYDDALKKTTFRNAKNVLSKTNEFLLKTI